MGCCILRVHLGFFCAVCCGGISSGSFSSQKNLLRRWHFTISLYEIFVIVNINPLQEIPSDSLDCSGARGKVGYYAGVLRSRKNSRSQESPAIIRMLLAHLSAKYGLPVRRNSASCLPASFLSDLIWAHLRLMRRCLSDMAVYSGILAPIETWQSGMAAAFANNDWKKIISRKIIWGGKRIKCGSGDLGIGFFHIIVT